MARKQRQYNAQPLGAPKPFISSHRSLVIAVPLIVMVALGTIATTIGPIKNWIDTQNELHLLELEIRSSSNTSTSAALQDAPLTSTNAYKGGKRISTTKSHNSPKSVQQAQQSLHPKWKLWIEMTPTQQQAALEEVSEYLNKYGRLLTQQQGKTSQQKIKHGTCNLVAVAGAGDHQLCGPAPGPDEKCSFLSFGINDDPSFDIALAEKWGCRGFAGDPTVQHPSKLHDLVTFHSVGATTLKSNEERLVNKGGESEWWEVSMPQVRQFLRLDNITVLKLDCEGCEVAFARDILAEDPGFLFAVDQISVETHVTKTWIDSDEHVYYFALMFALLEEAGFVLEWSSVFGCSKRHEVAGCMPSLSNTEFPCGYKPWPGHPRVVIGYSCHDFLFRRDPSKAAPTRYQ